MIKAGTLVIVFPTPPGTRKHARAASWIKHPTVVWLQEDAPDSGTLDVLDVETIDGEFESIYDFNIAGSARRDLGTVRHRA